MSDGLIQLIYKSISSNRLTTYQLERMTSDFARNNQRLGVSGALFFDGQMFLQVIEGKSETVERLYEKIGHDARHDHVVRIYARVIARRRFTTLGMQSVDLRGSSHWNILKMIPSQSVQTVINAFVEGLWREPPTRATLQFPDTTARPSPDCVPEPDDIGFAFQPVVDIRRRRVSSYEALLRGPGGESPSQVLARHQDDARYRFDLFSKAAAFQAAARLFPGVDVSINLFPRSLLSIPDLPEELLRLASTAGLEARQVIVEITEEELVQDTDRFLRAVSRLRALDFRLAIDDFGAGHAGLSLLADFQPQKLKMDRKLIHGIASSGARQSIVLAILDCSRRMGMSLVAEGVENLDDLEWLYNAGIHRVQGFLLSRPTQGRIPVVHYPVVSSLEQQAPGHLSLIR